MFLAKVEGAVVATKKEASMDGRKLLLVDRHEQSAQDEGMKHLLAFCDEVVLNVRSDNPAAVKVYESLGYSVKAEFEERLVIRRTNITLPRFLRRIFGGV